MVRSIEGDPHTSYSAVGQATHLAARMEQLATPGTIQLTADTQRLIEGYVDVKPLGLRAVEGVLDPVEVFEVVGVGPARTRLHAAARRGLTPFVGRVAEVQHLQRTLEQARQDAGA